MSRVTKRIFILISLSVMIFSSSAYAQKNVTKSHEIGILWESMFPTGSIPAYAPLADLMTYPGGDFFKMEKKNLAGLGLWIGMKNWTDTLGVFHTHYVSEGGFENEDAQSFTDPISNKKKVRNRLPVVKVNGDKEERLLDTRSSSSRDKNLIADEKIETIWATDVGVQVNMTSWALANQNHNSYIIREYTFTNDGVTNGEGDVLLPNQNLTEVYFGFQIYTIPGGDRGHDLIGQHDDWAVYYGNQAGDTLRGIYYKYDGVADDNHYSGDDTGDPDWDNGEFLSTQYPAFGVLHADKAYNDQSDDRSQPSTVDIKPRKFHKSYVKSHVSADLYSELISGVQSQGTAGKSVNPYDPDVIEPVALLSFGPYDIPFGESVSIVLYEAVGSISQEQAITAGNQWKGGTLEFEGLSGDQAKNALVGTALDSLSMIASRAEYAWNIGLENLPSPPAAPDNFFIESGPGKIQLSWKSLADDVDWQTGEEDFAGYRIYRAEDTYTNVYNLIKEIKYDPADEDVTEYTDWDVERGKRYYYAVTAFDDGTKNTTGVIPGQVLESSRFYNRNYALGAVSFLGAMSNLDSVYVVPNPYHIQGMAYGGNPKYEYDDVPRIEEKIAFVGLPARAVIRIFSMHGDLLATVQHPNPENSNSILGSADEEWFQITEQWQNIKSGVYIYYVEGWDLDGKALGSTTGKFVIIR